MNLDHQVVEKVIELSKNERIILERSHFKSPNDYNKLHMEPSSELFEFLNTLPLEKLLELQNIMYAGNNTLACELEEYRISCINNLYRQINLDKHLSKGIKLFKQDIHL